MSLLLCCLLLGQMPVSDVDPTPDIEKSSEPNSDVSSQPASSVEPLDITSFVSRFKTVDPNIQIAQSEHSKAALDLKLSQQRTRIHLKGEAPVGYELFAIPQNDPLHLGHIGISSIGVGVNDGIGGALDVNAGAQLVTEPRLSDGGNTLAANLSYALPLWRNLAGALYELETQRRSDLELARQAETDTTQIDQCARGAGLFVDAYLLQEQEAIWQELLAHKKRIQQRTANDYARRMVTRLDHLAAHSDWLLAQQRYEDSAAKRRQLRAQLETYLAAADSQRPLYAPDDVFAKIASNVSDTELAHIIDKHPMLVAVDKHLQALKYDDERRMRSFAPEIFIVPSLGVGYMSSVLLSTGNSQAAAYTPLTHAYASLGVRVEAPLLEPQKDYEHEQILQQRIQLEAQRRELARVLTEQARVAHETIYASEAQAALTAQKLELLRKQIAEAASMYNAGRLEFQDYLQHWTFYEEARFEQLALQHARWRGQLQLLRVLGTEPSFCKEEK